MDLSVTGQHHRGGQSSLRQARDQGPKEYYFRTMIQPANSKTQQKYAISMLLANRKGDQEQIVLKFYSPYAIHPNET